ncbi:MAG: GTP-binding protein [Candidatus Helarchaeota archaeon]
MGRQDGRVLALQDKFNQLLHNYVVFSKDVLATAIVDSEGLIVASEMDPRIIDEEAVGGISAAFQMASDRIKNEFSIAGHYGVTIDTEQGTFIFTQAGTKAMLVTLTNEDADTSKILPYSYIAAEKISQIIDLGKSDISLEMPDLSQKHDTRFTFKLIVLGEGAVGKTSLINQFVEKKFSADYKSTIGVNILTKSYNLFENVEIKFAIYDLAGQKYFRKIRKSYFRGTQAAIFVFDVTAPNSLEKIHEWVKNLEAEIGALKYIKSILVGNKIDLDRKVEFMAAKEVADSYGMPYIETSAKTGTNVDKAFGRIAMKLAVDNLMI